MNGLAVVTADEMKRLEKLAIDSGEDEHTFMEKAGEGIAKIVEKFLLSPTPSITISLLIGKGNNGGDAFVVGQKLLKKGFSVVAFQLFPREECSSLSKQMARRFEKEGGEIKLINQPPTFEKGVIIDGLVGTGFKGFAKGLLAGVIEAANTSELPIFAIDIPSGLNGNTGQVESGAIRAHTTIALGLPKIGFFLDQGWKHVGKLAHVDFGLPQKFIEEADASAYLISKEKAHKALPKLERDRHKYQAGYVLAIAGSASMPGAAIMSCLSTLKAGAGIVRLFHPEGMREELAASPYEIIKEEWDLKDSTRIFKEEERAKALIIGPGMGRTPQVELAIRKILPKVTIPTVIDADALYFLGKNKEMTLPETTILTPHHGEMEKLIDAPPTIENCLDYVGEHHVTLVLKGAPTIIFHPHTKPLIVPYGDPGMATAGTGDVLTGIIAAFLAQQLPPRDAASLGVLLHALSGEIAAEKETSYSVVATDLIEFLPNAFEKILHF